MTNTTDFILDEIQAHKNELMDIAKVEEVLGLYHVVRDDEEKKNIKNTLFALATILTKDAIRSASDVLLDDKVRAEVSNYRTTLKIKDSFNDVSKKYIKRIEVIQNIHAKMVAIVPDFKL